MEKAVVVVEWDEKEDKNKSKRNARRLVFGIGYFGGAFLCDAWRRGSGNDGVKKREVFRGGGRGRQTSVLHTMTGEGQAKYYMLDEQSNSVERRVLELNLSYGSESFCIGFNRFQ